MCGELLRFGCDARLPIGTASELRVLIPVAQFDYPGQMSRPDWSDAESDLIVADYFAMLADDLSGRRYNKAEHRRRLTPLLSNRSDGSLEFKHQNISAVLKGLGEDWIPGYRPASLQAAATLLPSLCKTSICYSFVTISSAPNLFFSIDFLVSRLPSLNSPGSENIGQVRTFSPDGRGGVVPTTRLQ